MAVVQDLDVENGLDGARIPGVGPQKRSVGVRSELVNDSAVGDNVEERSLGLLEDRVPEECIHLLEQKQIGPGLLG